MTLFYQFQIPKFGPLLIFDLILWNEKQHCEIFSETMLSWISFMTPPLRGTTGMVHAQAR